MAGWLEGEVLVSGRILPRTLLFRSDEKLLEMAARGGALKCLADRQALQQALVQGRGGIQLELSHPQLATLASAGEYADSYLRAEH